MDPNAALRRLREILAGDHSENPDHWTQVDEGELESVIEEASTLFDGLDEWLKSGGFSPSDWDPMSGGPRR